VPLLGDGPAQRKDQGHPDDEHKQREDQVIEGEPVPIFVRQLPPEKACQTGLANPVQAADEAVGPENPEHVKAPQGIDRHQPPRRRGPGPMHRL